MFKWILALLGILLTGSALGQAPPTRTPTLQRLEASYLRRLHEDVESLARKRVPVRLKTRFRDYRCVLHAHSYLSHDSRGTLAEIAAAAKEAHVAAVFLTNHPQKERDVVTAGQTAPINGVLFASGAETNGFLAFPGDGRLPKLDVSEQAFVDSIRASSGLVFVAHPEEHTDWELKNLTGMEIYNTHADFKDEKELLKALQPKVSQGYLQFPTLLNAIRIYPQEAFAALFDPPVENLRHYDALSVVRPYAAIAGNDSHQNTGFVFRGGAEGKILVETPLGETLGLLSPQTILSKGIDKPEPGKEYLRELLDPYEVSFHYVSTHVLATQKTLPALKTALAEGRTYVAFDWIADPTGTAFVAQEGQRSWTIGDTIPLQERLTLRAEAPLAGTLRLVRDGVVVATAEGRMLSFAVTDPGVYRLEVSLSAGGEQRPWIYTGAIRVTDRQQDRAERRKGDTKVEMAVTLTSAAKGQQLVRVSLPLQPGFLAPGFGLTAFDGRQSVRTATRVLTRFPGEKTSFARRVLVTFPYTFRDLKPVHFLLRPTPEAKPVPPRLPVKAVLLGDTLTLTTAQGSTWEATLVAPARSSQDPPHLETVEENGFYLWQRYHIPDPQWPRIIEIRTDIAGGIVVVAHLQRNLPGDGRAPDFGWTITDTTKSATRETPAGNRVISVSADGEDWRIHEFTKGDPYVQTLDKDYKLTIPIAPYRHRGEIRELGRRKPDSVRTEGTAYRYLACKAEEKIPMQQASWRRAEFVLSPSGLADLGPTLESPHTAQVDWKIWDALYKTGKPLDLSVQPDLAALLAYHHDATVHAMTIGDDFGNVTSFADGSATGSAFGMNRLNHCPAIFEEGYRSGDRRLIDTGVLWCDNFYDLSIWWGPDKTGGTRYNNLVAMGGKPPDNDNRFMWRSNSAVSFCTKGFAAFFMAYEQTGDPRMREALDAQVEYSAHFLDAGANYTRNIGCVHDFLMLYRFTGDPKYRREALRLFGDLRTQLSTGDLFTESGRPIQADPPFIENDKDGYDHPFAKPYILGYALEGLPELARLAPEEPKLRSVVQSVADFMAQSQDPVGGWRYPHPRSSYVIISQGIEHAWQLKQSCALLGAQDRYLDAIERVLRQRILGWKKTGKTFGGLTGWETATGDLKPGSNLGERYKHPEDRDQARDYREGRADFGGSSPEGLVYFPEVLAFYLQHRPAARLLAAPTPEEPLGQVLSRVPQR